MKSPIKIEDLRNSACAKLNPHLFGEQDVQKKPNKFRNQPTVVEGEKFPSVKEAKRYRVLKIELKAGKIAFLARQVEYELNAPGTHSLVYKSDFNYTIVATGEAIVEDCKGHRTREYLKKRRLMLKVHKIKILET